jgi:putative ABC transport system ATP-binding protein
VSSPAVEAVDVRRSYQLDGVSVEALRGVSLRIDPGEYVAVVGPSGSGKSTLMHLLGCLDRPTSGVLRVGDRDVATLGDGELATLRNRTIGFVFQFHQLLPDFTALENVILPGRIAGSEPKRLLVRAQDLLAEVGLAERMEHFPNQLSGGERQRVAICRALMLEPPLLLADEPTGNLDPASGDQVFDLLLDLQLRHGTTGLLVTHNPQIAERCTRTLRLEGGVLLPDEPPPG